MNQVNEKISPIEIVKGCRELVLSELMSLLKSDISVFWSWGAHAFRVDNLKRPRMFRMMVNGHHHSGHVYIFLNGSDLFDVYLTSKVGTIKKIGKDLYFDMLVDWIDENVERVPEYNK